jgi:periplasmic divalent cation tolerance protein
VVSESDERLSLVLCNAPPDAALRIAREIVERRLAACVNVVPGVTSVYRWQGAVHEDPESTLLMKTRVSLVEALTVAVRELHPYEVPEVIAVPLEQGAGNPAYLAWVLDETRTPR